MVLDELEGTMLRNKKRIEKTHKQLQYELNNEAARMKRLKAQDPMAYDYLMHHEKVKREGARDVALASRDAPGGETVPRFVELEQRFDLTRAQRLRIAERLARGEPIVSTAPPPHAPPEVLLVRWLLIIIIIVIVVVMVFFFANLTLQS
jgi:hypothetical protein